MAILPTLTARAGMLVVALMLSSHFGLAQPLNYRDQDLHGQDFSRKNLRQQDFSRADLQKADLSFANLSNAILKNAKLNGANLKGTWFLDADLTEADLREAQTKGANFRNAKLVRANLSGMTLYLAQAQELMDGYADIPSGMRYSLRDAGASPDKDNGNLTFQGADLHNAQIFGNVAGVNFRGANLRGADLSQADNLREAILRGAIYDEHTRWKVDPAQVGAVKAP